MCVKVIDYHDHDEPDALNNYELTNLPGNLNKHLKKYTTTRTYQQILS